MTGIRLFVQKLHNTIISPTDYGGEGRLVVFSPCSRENRLV